MTELAVESAMAKKWYVIQTYSGYENKVKEALLQRIKEHGEGRSFGEILIPTETVQESPRQRQAAHPPEDQPPRLHLRRDGDERGGLAPRQGHAEGHRLHRQPASAGGAPPQIEDLRSGIVEGAVKPKPRVNFDVGDEVRVIDGAFANFSGTVEEVKPDKQKLKVKVSIFGRATPVELDFSQVEKRA